MLVMQARLRPHLERFRQWLGHWRGAGKFADSREMMMEIAFTPVLDGAALQVTSGAFELKTGVCINAGTGYWSVDKDGKLVSSSYSFDTGALLMREVPEDPPGICIEGVYDGSTRFTVAIVPEGETLTMTTRRTAGYNQGSKPLTYGVMRRVAPAAPAAPRKPK
jgi:hypothetical protein